MPDLDYGYEVTIAQNATSDPVASSVTNQWQRQIQGNTRWDDIGGASGETYKIAAGDRSAKIRLQQDLDGAKAYSNELQVTSKEFDLADGLNEIGNLSSDYQKWIGGVLAPNGRIYGISFLSSSVLEIDPITKTTRTFGNLDIEWGGYKGGVLAPNGKIYALPYNQYDVLEIDPRGGVGSGDEPNLLRFGFISTGQASLYCGGVLAPNGKIYGVPHNTDKILEIDPVNRTLDRFPVPGYFSSERWFGGVLGPNGKIYCIPFNSSEVLEIDPITKTTRAFGNNVGTRKWKGGVLARNGKIYGIPYDASSILEIDPNNRTTRTFGSLTGTLKWSGGALAPNGKIYGFSSNSTEILEIDPVGQTAKTFGSLGDYPGMKWGGGVLAPNGKLYGIPQNWDSVLEIDLGLPAATGTPGSENWALSGLPGDILDPRSAYFNKL